MNIRRKRGIALISVLLILTALMVLTMGFAAYTMVDHLNSQSYQAQAVTFYLAQAGLEYVYYLTTHNMLIFPCWNTTNDHPSHVTGVYAGTTIPNQEYTAMGEASNVFGDFDPNSDVGEEHLLISDLTWGTSQDPLVAQILKSNSYFGTFKVKVVENADNNSTDPKRRALYIKSVGKIRERLPGSPAPTGAGVNFANDSQFPVRAQRTLYARIPYVEDSYLELETGVNREIFYQVMTDGWYEKFR